MCEHSHFWPQPACEPIVSLHVYSNVYLENSLKQFSAEVPWIPSEAKQSLLLRAHSLKEKPVAAPALEHSGLFCSLACPAF